MQSPYFEAKLTTLKGEAFTPDLGEPTIEVVMGEDEAKPGLGETIHLGRGVWRYIADEGEYGDFPTVVIFSAPDCVIDFDRHCGTMEAPRLPEGWDTLRCISRVDFLELVMGMKPRADYADWLAMLAQSDPIPLTDRIKHGLARAYPQLIK